MTKYFFIILLVISNFACQNPKYIQIAGQKYAASLPVLVLGREVKKIPNEVEYFTQLKRLNIAYAFGNKVPSSIAKFKTIEILTIEQDTIVVPESIAQLNQLHTLNLIGYVKRLPQQLSLLPNLKNITIEDTSLTEIPKNIYQCKQLEELLIEKSKVKMISNDIEHLINLKKLKITHAQIKELPSTIGKLKALQHLNLSVNQIQRLPHSFAQLANLQTLNIDHNGLIELPNQIFALPKLKRLYISFYHNNVPEGLIQKLFIEKQGKRLASLLIAHDSQKDLDDLRLPSVQNKRSQKQKK